MSNNNPNGKESDGVECPTCGKSGFDGEHGMKIHHAHSHDEKIGTEPLVCEICGDGFEVKDARADEARFCSNECRGKWISDNTGGKDHPQAKREEIKCAVCGDVREEPKSIAQVVYTCGSESCVSKYKERISPTREDHPNWKGGYKNDYGPNWERQRREARERDNYRCQYCGVNEDRLDRQVSVHHVEPIGWFRKQFDAPEWYERGNELENLVCLCPHCHSIWEGVPVRPKLINNDRGEK